MTRVFADTSFYLALMSVRDRWHRAAVDASSLYACDVVTSEFVLLELGALMARGSLRRHYVALVKQLREDEATYVVPVTTERFDAGLQLFANRADKEWSLTDCISFALMNEEGIDVALTTDKHFVQAGFHSPVHK